MIIHDLSLFFATLTQQMHGWMLYLWLTIGISLLVIELLAPTLFLFVSLAIGCSIAALLSLLSDSVTWQLIGMAVGSIISFLIINKTMVKEKKQRELSNYEALVGQEGVVIKAITHEEAGIVKIRGEQWSAVSEKGLILYKGTIVTVTSVAGNKIIVS